MIYSRAWERDNKNNIAFILPFVLSSRSICMTDCFRTSDIEYIGEDIFIKLYYQPKSKQQYFWLLKASQENEAYFNSFQENLEGNVYTVVKFLVPKNLHWIVNMLTKTQYKNISKRVILTAVLFWKDYIYKIIENEETLAARESSQGFISFNY